MKIHAFSSLGIALAMFLTGPCAALPDTNREGKVQVPDLSVNPYGKDSSYFDVKFSFNVFSSRNKCS